MRNFWLMARHEYRKRVGTRSFLLATLGVPALIVVIMVVSILVAIGSESDLPVGYVDHAGLLDPALYAEPYLGDMDDRLGLLPYADEEAAGTALEAGEIQGFYVLPAGYPQNPEIDVYYLEEAPPRGDFADFVRANLVARFDVPAAATWLVDGPDVTVRDAASGRELGANSFVAIILPFATAFFFFFALVGSAGYLLEVVADEKENRTMEILITSISSLQMIAGKALGLMGVALTQITLWLVAIVVGLLIAANYVAVLARIEVPWMFLVVIALYFLPAYVLIAGIMTAIGGAVTEVQQGQQISGILNLLFIAPFFFIVLIFSSPNSPLLIFLTLFPTTSFLTVVMRYGITGIPVWQMVASWMILGTTAALMLVLAARIFRLGMLRYGQRLNMHEIVATLRGTEA
jgi:ABC-2 type transport system permease protein